jgi:hypothetical protein
LLGERVACQVLSPGGDNRISGSHRYELVSHLRATVDLSGRRVAYSVAMIWGGWQVLKIHSKEQLAEAKFYLGWGQGPKFEGQ